MVKSKTCNLMELKCEELSCSVEVQPKEEYSYWTDQQRTGFFCSIRPRLIVANEPTDYVFHKLGPNKCMAKDLSCQLEDSTLVWPQSIISNCNYRRVASLALDLDSTYNIAYNVEKHVLFQMKNDTVIKDCNISLIPTAQGLYLTYDKAALNLKISDLAENDDLILADSDMTDYLDRKRLMR